MNVDKKIWVNGTFDVLHIGHIRLLEYAKSLGGTLYVGVDGDDRVKELKGNDRPVNDIHDRLEMLRALKCVDFVYAFDQDVELKELIGRINPSIMVVGDDYKDKEVIGAKYIGGVRDVRYFPKLPRYSTTKILNHIMVNHVTT